MLKDSNTDQVTHGGSQGNHRKDYPVEGKESETVINDFGVQFIQGLWRSLDYVSGYEV